MMATFEEVVMKVQIKLKILDLAVKPFSIQLKNPSRTENSAKIFLSVCVV